MLNTKSVIKYFKAWHPYGLSKKSDVMRSSTEMSSFGMARCLKIYLFFLHLNLDHIIRLPFDFMNIHKWQLFYYYIFLIFCAFVYP